MNQAGAQEAVSQNYTVLFPTINLTNEANQAISDVNTYSRAGQFHSKSPNSTLRANGNYNGDYDNDTSSRTLRRNSYTKAIFFENSECE